MGEVPELDLDEQQSQNVPTTKTTRARAVSAKKRSGKRCHVGETAPAQIGANTSVPRRRPLGRKVKRSTYRETDGSSSSENELDDDRDEDVNPSDFDLPEEATKVSINLHSPYATDLFSHIVRVLVFADLRTCTRAGDNVGQIHSMQ